MKKSETNVNNEEEKRDEDGNNAAEIDVNLEREQIRREENVNAMLKIKLIGTRLKQSSIRLGTGTEKIEFYRGTYKRGPVAIKVFPQDADETRFGEEAVLAYRCGIHLHIVQVKGVVTGEDKKIVMELMETSLHDALAEPRLESFSRRLHLLRGIATALHFLHIQGIAHRGINSENILLSKELTVAKLSDFGEATVTSLDQQGGVVQASLLAHEDMRHFGSVVWKCANGRDDEDIQSTTAPGNLTASELGSWKKLKQVALGCLSEDPNLTAEEALGQCGEESDPASFHDSSNIAASRKWWCRLSIFLAVAVAVIGIVGVVIWFAVSGGDSSPGPTQSPVAAPPPPANITSLAFQKTEELYAAVDDYAGAANPVTSTAAITYGYPIGTWDVSLITTFQRLFSPLRNGVLRTFDEALNDWDVSAATNMNQMFRGAAAFSGRGLSSWNVSRVINMAIMFEDVVAFSGDLSAWSVGSVTDMNNMFSGASAFDSNISSWNVNKVTDMSFMFFEANAFDQNLCSWQTRLPLNCNVDSIFSGALSCPSRTQPVLPNGPIMCHICT